MSTSVVVEPGTNISVGMGQIMLGCDSACLGTVLGSCIGVTLYHERWRIAAMAHVVLPESHGRQGSAGKFADKAIPAMIELLDAEGATPGGLVAKLAGGAHMFGGNADSPLQIGRANARVVIEALQAARIKILGQDIGGTKGRRVTFECATGGLNINVVGCATKTL